jgi:hypothetical protein
MSDLPGAVSSALFSDDEVPVRAKAKLSLKRGGDVIADRGFGSKKEAHLWIESMGRRLDWRAGYIFRLRGLNQDLEIIDREGNRITP